MYIIGNEKVISFQTREERNISCTICNEISQFNRRQLLEVEKDWPRAIKRTKPSGIYNCHGMIFASRRCSILDTQDVLNILEVDDNYQEIVDIKKTLPGDIVIYYADGDVQHSGMVIEKPKPDLFYKQFGINKILIIQIAKKSIDVGKPRFYRYDRQTLVHFMFYKALHVLSGHLADVRLALRLIKGQKQLTGHEIAPKVLALQLRRYWCRK